MTPDLRDMAKLTTQLQRHLDRNGDIYKNSNFQLLLCSLCFFIFFLSLFFLAQNPNETYDYTQRIELL